MVVPEPPGDGAKVLIVGDELSDEGGLVNVGTIVDGVVPGADGDGVPAGEGVAAGDGVPAGGDVAEGDAAGLSEGVGPVETAGAGDVLPDGAWIEGDAVPEGGSDEVGEGAAGCCDVGALGDGAGPTDGCALGAEGAAGGNVAGGVGAVADGVGPIVPGGVEDGGASGVGRPVCDVGVGAAVAGAAVTLIIGGGSPCRSKISSCTSLSDKHMRSLIRSSRPRRPCLPPPEHRLLRKLHSLLSAESRRRVDDRSRGSERN